MNDIQRLERIYGIAGRELRTMLLALDPLGYTGEKGQAVMAKTRELVRILNGAVVRWADTAIPAAYAKGERTARTALEILGRKPKRSPLFDKRSILSEQAALTMIKANNSIPVVVGEYLSVLGSSAYDANAIQAQEFTFGDIVAKVDRLVASAIGREKSRRWLFMVIREHLAKVIKTGEFIRINGRKYVMKKYAALVARTELRRANTIATIETSREYESDLVQWSSHGTDCPECAKFEGKTYSLSGKSHRYPRLEAEPPIHPNCQHLLLCTSEEAIEIEERRGESDLARKLREAKERGETLYEYSQRIIKEKNLWGTK